MTDHTSPALVSVIIPTYNRSELLSEAIRSVLQQTYRPIECIVVDDGSTDHTQNVLDELSNKLDPGFTLVCLRQQHAGAQHSRNAGTRAANGKYIQYLDSDDLLYPGKIKSQVDFLTLHPDIDGVFGDWHVGLPESKQIFTAYRKEDLLFQILTECPIANFSMLMTREIVQQIGDWDTSLKRNQEIDFHCRGILTGGDFRYLPGVTGLWRKHPENRIGNTSQLADVIFAFRKWENILKEKHLWNDDYSGRIAINYLWSLGNHPSASIKEIVPLLREINRLNPRHPIFMSPKFRFTRSIFGFNKAAALWAKRYKKNQKSKS